MRDPLDAFATNLRRARRARGLSQEELAHEAGLGVSHVAKIERRERNPGIRTVSKLLLALGAEANELFDGLDSRRRDNAK